MGRALFEFEDQPWFPAFLRDYQTDFLGFLAEKMALYRPAQAVLEEEIEGDPGVICDLGSGAGIAAVMFTATLRSAGWQVILTDKFPNASGKMMAQNTAGVSYTKDGLDLLSDELPQASVYTMFNAFHHFSLDEQLHIAGAVKAKGGSLFVFEPLQPTISVFMKVAMVTSIGLLIAVPFIKPLTLRRLLLTYILPIGILVTLWDGLVSVIRSLSMREIETFAAEAANKQLSVRHRYVRTKLAQLTYISIQ